jgi:hypothetical protein
VCALGERRRRHPHAVACLDWLAAIAFHAVDLHSEFLRPNTPQHRITKHVLPKIVERFADAACRVIVDRFYCAPPQARILKVRVLRSALVEHALVISAAEHRQPPRPRQPRTKSPAARAGAGRGAAARSRNDRALKRAPVARGGRRGHHGLRGIHRSGSTPSEGAEARSDSVEIYYHCGDVVISEPKGGAVMDLSR